MMGRRSIDLSREGPGDQFPFPACSWCRRQSRLPDPQKKKKKKWREAEAGAMWRWKLHTAVRWRLCECGGMGVEAKRK